MKQTLEGKFSILSSLLFKRKAKEFYWRYHKNTQELRWDYLWQFREARTDLDIREAIRDWKQQRRV